MAGFKRGFYRKGLFLVLIAAIIIAFIFFFPGIIKKDCKQDKECFSQAFEECKPSKYLVLIDNNYYSYTIKDKNSDSCILRIKLEKMAVGTPIDLLEKFEGKSMTCRIPIERLDTEIEEISNIINFCTGPLKESIYELIIEKLYGLVLRNMGELISQVQEQLYEIK